MKIKIQYNHSLYVISNQELIGNRLLTTVIQETINGGATIIQYREKRLSSKEMINQARQLRTITANAKIPLIINDRIDIALEVHCDGVHVGQKDISAVEARKMIGKNMILGVSASNVAQAKKAQDDEADYLGVGPIFPTSTKIDVDPVVGLKGLADIKKAVSIPVIAIGGINAKNAEQVAKIADGIAVVSAIMSAADPQQATRELLSVILNSRK
ncbi:thiamine phosphate synthase [Candidatus Roizmanbacteria bacterium]|nr:thiamine phosphate synthase [Candidatus Roizmanbacteria bacterium]